MYLETKNISKKYKKETVLKDVSLNLESGQIYGLLGPNGSGKSTIMKIMCGIVTPTKGEMFVKGEPWQQKDLLKIGALIEGPAIYENLTAEENLRVITLLLGLPKQRITEVLRLVDLQAGNKVAKKFSLGMKQRLGIAMALLKHPELLILDEPTNGLDPLGIEELRQLLVQLAQNGMTILISSHVLSEIQLLADKVGILYQGELLYEQANDHQDLERVFMEIIRRSKGGVSHGLLQS